MTIRLSTVVRDALVNDVIERLAVGGTLIFYEGDVPVTLDPEFEGTPLVTFNIADTNFTLLGDGTIGLTGPIQATAAAAGEAGYFQLWNGTDSQAIAIGSIGTELEYPDLVLTNTVIAPDVIITLQTLILSAGNA